MRAKGNRHINLGMIVLLGALSVAASAEKRRKEPPPPESVKVSVKIPTLAPLGETQPLQEKGGLKISVAPVAYQVKTVYEYKTRRATQSFKEQLLSACQPPAVF